MLRKEVHEKSGLTRKAIEYYEERGLINPKKTENGYRDYSSDDLQLLTKIALYRKVGLTVTEIEELLLSGEKTLVLILRKKQYQLEVEEKRKDILELMVKGVDSNIVNEKLNIIEKEETLYSKLERTFPGYFGQMIFSAYQPFLNEPLREAGYEAYTEYVKYLDNLPPFVLSAKEQEYIEENTDGFDFNKLKAISSARISAVENPEKWWSENKEIIEKCKEYKDSDEYLTSPMKQIQDKLKKYMQDNHYYEVAIPLIRKFSKSYDEYYTKLIEADKIFLTKMGLEKENENNTF